SGTYLVSPKRSSHCFTFASPGVRQRSTNSSVADAAPTSSAITGAVSSSPTRKADAPSPPAASSVLVGRPPRRPALTTSTGSRLSGAARRDPTPERTAPPVWIAGELWSRRSAAWIVVALVFSRYAGLAVANHSDRGSP